MRPSIDPLHPLPLTIIWWLTSNFYPIHADRLLTHFRVSLLFVDLTFTQLLFTLVLTHIYLHSTSSTRPSPPASQNLLPRSTLPVLHILATLFTNLSYYKLGAVRTLLCRFLQPLFTIFLNFVFLHESCTHISIAGIFLTVLGVYNFSDRDFIAHTYLPILLATLLFSVRDTCIRLTKPTRTDTDDVGKLPDDAHCAMVGFNDTLLRAFPVAFVILALKVLKYGFHVPVIMPLVWNSCMLAVYHFASILLVSRVDAVYLVILRTLRRFSAVMLAILVLSIPLSLARFEALGLVFTGFVLYLVGRSPQQLPASTVVLAFLSGGLVFAAFLGGFRGVVSDARVVASAGLNASESVERVDGNTWNSNAHLVIPIKDYLSARKFVRYEGYDEALKHDTGNVGNLVWRYAAHERLPDFEGVPKCDTDDVVKCVEKARNMGMENVVYKPVANLLNPDTLNAFAQTSDSIKKNGLKPLIIGMGVQIPFRFGSGDPEFNSSARITTTSDDYLHPENTKRYLRTMEEAGGEMLLRGDFALNVTRKGGFSRGYSLGCPSLWINDDVHLGRTLEEKYKAISARRGDKSLKIAVNLKKVCPGIEKQIIHFRDNYPNSRFYMQGPGDMRLLSSLKVPYERTRFFSNVEDWIEDLKEMDVAYGVRIHGNMIAIGAGLPALVAASDWRVLELVQRMKIPYVTSYDPVFDEDVDVARIIDEMPRFDGDAFDRNRCEIGKVYIKVFQRYGIGVKRHVREVSELC